MGRLILQIFGAFAEFERSLIQERTKAGLAAARARGRKGGRRKKLSKEQQEHAIALYRKKEKTAKEICELMGISKTTLYTYVQNDMPFLRKK